MRLFWNFLSERNSRIARFVRQTRTITYEKSKNFSRAAIAAMRFSRARVRQTRKRFGGIERHTAKRAKDAKRRREDENNSTKCPKMPRNAPTLCIWQNEPTEGCGTGFQPVQCARVVRTGWKPVPRSVYLRLPGFTWVDRGLPFSRKCKTNPKPPRPPRVVFLSGPGR